MKNMIKSGLAALGLEQRARDAAWRVRHFGLRYQCPFCHGHLRGFLPEGERHAVLFELEVVGGGYRQNVTCPFCGSVDRERLVFLFLSQRPELLAGRKRLMHVAPELKLLQWLKATPGVDYLSADLMEDYVDVNLDLTQIPYAEASFDAIIANHVMEHIPEDAKAMREILRVLQPGGWAILQAPMSSRLPTTIEDPAEADPAERERRFGQNDHIRIYEPRDYAARLKRAGFAVEVFRWEGAGKDFGGPANRFGLLPKETLFFVTRPHSVAQAGLISAA